MKHKMRTVQELGTYSYMLNVILSVFSVKGELTYFHSTKRDLTGGTVGV